MWWSKRKLTRKIRARESKKSWNPLILNAKHEHIVVNTHIFSLIFIWISFVSSDFTWCTQTHTENCAWWFLMWLERSRKQSSDEIHVFYQFRCRSTENEVNLFFCKTINCVCRPIYEMTWFEIQRTFIMLLNLHTKQEKKVKIMNVIAVFFFS